MPGPGQLSPTEEVGDLRNSRVALAFTKPELLPFSYSFAVKTTVRGVGALQKLLLYGS